MRLLLSVPSGVLVDAMTSRVTAESDHGSFTILPRHADCALLLVPGLFSYESPDGEEVFVAIDDGVLVKSGRDVRVACQRAVIAGSLERAEAQVAERLRQQDEQSRRARAALLRLEADLMRRIGDLV